MTVREQSLKRVDSSAELVSPLLGLECVVGGCVP